ncbi:D-beta-hydroxybutyrate dehydrogenase, mitochondrial-like [Pecten maximus]|uniref:D-beta-hydroxybutyrate dehydrogenase, mitochondrial-like n=1 Tax=Pecten maximus TaxID=6579 RepID=UPI00145914DA|nr:D-beta-hydroxybutyrate dehydrogenase, mitochondrial-like [Pecten maximus]
MSISGFCDPDLLISAPYSIMLSLENTCVLYLLLLNVYFLFIYWKYLLAISLVYILLRLTRNNFRQKLDIGRKGVVITGCDTGFGHLLAKRLYDLGYRVYAGVLSLESPGAKVLQARQSDRLHVIKLDVTKDDDVQKALEYVNATGLWAIVNNAGIYFPGDVELATVDQYKKCAEVNLYGMIRVTKAFLPPIRKSKGRIVNMSSVMGRFSRPSGSVYSVTKYGIETLSDSLRLEMKKFGVNVSIIEPGVFIAATSVLGPEQLTRLKKEINYMWEQASDDVRQTYGRPYFDDIYQGMEKSGLNVVRTQSADPVINAIEDSLISVTPKARYMIGGSFSIVDKLAIFAKVYSILPEYISDWIFEKMI